MAVSFLSLVLRLVGGDTCPTARDDSCDLFDSTRVVPPRSGRKAEVRVSPVGLALAVGLYKWNERGSLVPNQESVCQDLGLRVLSMSSW